jgi:hypothetical protein
MIFPTRSFRRALRSLIGFGATFWAEKRKGPQAFTCSPQRFGPAVRGQISRTCAPTWTMSNSSSICSL